jgi:2-polyprenyl-6-methoxyphenol hydroxylase-like FAD-dependent oxidoreductase
MKVVIAGGGVAGAVAAVALRRIGASVTVVEAYEEPAGEVGSFISLSGNALRALDDLGLRDQMRRQGFPVPRQQMRSSSGRLLGDLPRGRLHNDPVHSVTLMRGALVRELRTEALRSGAGIHTGRRVTGFDGQNVVYADGATESCDLLVGADGIHSTVRRILDPAAPEPEYAGLYSVSGVSDLPVGPGLFTMTFARAGAFAHITAPDGKVWWSAQVSAPEAPTFEGVDWLPKLRDLYRHESHVLEVLRTATHLHRPTLMHVLAEVPVQHTDSAVLIGDAAHPVGAGQGAALAIEDAIVLAGALEAAESFPEGLARFDAIRRPRTRRMLAMADDNRGAKKAGWAKQRLTDVMMPVFFRFFHEKATAWMYTYKTELKPTRRTPYDDAISLNLH